MLVLGKTPVSDQFNLPVQTLEITSFAILCTLEGRHLKPKPLPAPKRLPKNWRN